jgi:hypothetical protein
MRSEFERHVIPFFSRLSQFDQKSGIAHKVASNQCFCFLPMEFANRRVSSFQAGYQFSLGAARLCWGFRQ